MTESSILGDISPQDFLENYWQKKPCLIRQAIPGYQCPVSADELAGLACETEIDARLVVQNRETAAWTVRHGPFREQDFQQLPATHWTLLVQAVDRYNPPINELLTRFDFIPNWRIDDVMISFAADQGSVGPHLDSYDVFLLQGDGKRHWHINTVDYTETDFVPGLDLRIIDHFTAEQDWLLNPGDMLYLPPGVAHHGIADGPCITLSIGFLAPAYRDLLHEFIDGNEVSATRYADPVPRLQDSAGEITAETLAFIRQNVRALLADDRTFDHWFGRYITGLNNEDNNPDITGSGNGLSAFTEVFTRHGLLYRSCGVRTAYICENEAVILFINGQAFPLSTGDMDLVRMICEKTVLERDQSTPILGLLHRLFVMGYYYFEND